MFKIEFSMPFECNLALQNIPLPKIALQNETPT
jgi:hypothetical protein